MANERVHLGEADEARPENGRRSRRPESIGSVAIEPERSRRAARSEHAAGGKRRHGPEAGRLHQPEHVPERLGSMLITAESKPAGRAEAPRPAGDLAALLAGRRIETLSRAELIDISEKVSIDASSLRQIYETHLIGERGLRHLLNEYLHGGDLKTALRDEIMEREKDFERDPAMRDVLPAAPAGDDDQPPATTLDDLLARAERATAGSSEEAAFFKARARYEADQLQQHKQRRRVLDIGLAALIAILVALIVVLLATRG